MPRSPFQLAKLTRPRLHAPIYRERLFKLLDVAREYPCVWIVGPPGAGKTTLAASYSEAAGAPTLWYQCDPGDSDPATFFFYLREAMGRGSSDKVRPLPLLTPEYVADLPSFARRFFRAAFQRLPQGALVVLDNYQDISRESQLHLALAASLEEVGTAANLVVASRADPLSAYARSQLNGLVATVSWEELRLTEDETKRLAAAKGIADPQLVGILHEQSGGWLAGATLMLEQLRCGGSVRTLDCAERLETVFDYFAGLVFDGAGADARDVLVRTSLVPRIDPALAEAVTGKVEAIHHVETLHAQHLFTDRHIGEGVTYQYHALFRRFLRDRAQRMLPAEERERITRRAAQVLEQAALYEDAFALHVDIGDWLAAEQLLVKRGSHLIGQGRWRTLKAWVTALPADRLDANPWIRYWLGRSQIFVDPVAARPILEDAYGAFTALKDRAGRLLSAAAVLEALYYDYNDFRAMDSWIERAAELLELSVVLPTIEDQLRVHAMLMMGAGYRAPEHPLLASWVQKVTALLSQPCEVNLRITVASMLLNYAHLAMDRAVHAVAIRTARGLLGAPQVTALVASFYLGIEAYTHYLDARYHESLECFDRADAIATEHGLTEVAIHNGIMRGLCERRANLLDAADATVRRVEPLLKRSNGQRTGAFELLRSVVALDRGDFERAVAAGLAAQRTFDEGGQYMSIVQGAAVVANALIAAGRLDLASATLAGTRARIRGPVGGCYLPAVALNEAWLAHRRGDAALRDAKLQEALRLGRDDPTRGRLHWFPNALSELLPVAIDRQIEADAARKLAREFEIAPAEQHIEQWPWAVRIYTLGRFELWLDDKPAAFSRKVPRKALLLLKALVAFGVQDVPEERLIDALWPDEDGDVAYRALAAMLHRLRALLGGPETLRQRGGALSLDANRCWVDAPAFEALAGEAAATSREQAMALYRGTFLGLEDDAPWAIPLREKLRAKFADAVARQGAELERAGELEAAVDCYTRGLAADDLVESFYQGLIRCYRALGREDAALGAYRRCRQILSARLGERPCSATERLVAALRAG